jgi:putative FmdB family regulatory protein
MPTYDYRCLACDHCFEAMQSIVAAPLKECPLCGGAVKRLVGGGIGLIFKGSGFYITDYGRKTGGGGNGGGKKTAADAGKETQGSPSTDKPSETSTAPSPPKPTPAKDSGSSG